MNESTTETTGLDFERVAQAARLVAPVTNGVAKNRRMLPVPPPPPSPRTGASATPLPLAKTARTPSAPNASDLLAWEEAAEQLEPDWATPVDGVEEAAEHTAPLVPEVSAEPGREAIKLPLIAIEAGDSPKASEPAPSDALALVEANISAGTTEEAKSEPHADEIDAADDGPVAPSREAKAPEAESDLEALARSITKSSQNAPASRLPLPGRPLPAPPIASRPPAPLPPPPPAVNRTQMLPLPPAPTRTPLPVATVTLTTDEPTPLPVATVTRTLPGPTPLPVATVAHPTLPPLSPPASSRPLPPLAPAPSRPPPPSAFRPSPVPPPASSRPAAGAPLPPPRSQLPTLPRMADREKQPELAAPSLLELRSSPVARRFYAQLGVAAVVGALLATILFALIPRQTTTVAVTASQPAPAAATNTVPEAARKQQAPTAVDTIPPPPPVKSLSVDDLAREPAAETKPRAKSAAAGAPEAAAPAPLAPKLAAALAAPAPAPAPAEPAAAAAKPEAVAPVAAKGTLHINATPPANVAIDGRPLGMTPKIVRLAPGSHRVALIGPGGRRSQTVNVGAGQTASVSVKF